MPTTIEIPRGEPWLAGYLREGDGDIEVVRERARKAAAGEVVRRRQGREPDLRVRQADGERLTTDGRERVVVGHEGKAVAKREEPQP